MKLAQRFRGRRNQDKVDLRWYTIPAARTAEHPGLIAKLIDQEIDGMMIQGVFTVDEVDRVLSRGDDLRGGAIVQTFGATLGMPLNMIGDVSQDRTPYLDDTARCRKIYREAFGFDPHERIAEVIGPMTGRYDVAVPEEDGRGYNPGNLRWYDPGKGGLKAHAGNEFVGLVADGAMTHLLTTTKIVDHMSYFVVLQPPSEGGALSVYDLLWRDHDDHETRWESAVRDDSFFDSQPCLKVTPGPGDMILFGGGWRWHRVDPIEGDVTRVTYGGFMGTALDGDELHVWS